MNTISESVTPEHQTVELSGTSSAVAETDNWDISIKIEEAYNLYDEGKYSKVINLCSKIHSKFPNQGEVLYLMGLATLCLGDLPVGEALIDHAVSISPEINDYDYIIPLICHQEGEQHKYRYMKEKLFGYRKNKFIDGYIISYPTCGRKWLSFMLCSSIHNNTSDDFFEKLNLLDLTKSRTEYTNVRLSWDDYPHWKKHTDIVEHKRMYKDKLVTLLVRDPRDVLVSYYFEYIKRCSKGMANDEGFDSYLSDFIHHDIGGLKNIVSFYNIWAKNRHVPEKFTMITYEDIQKDTLSSLRHLIGFFGWPTQEEACLNDIISKWEFKKMQKFEKTNPMFANPNDLPDPKDPEGLKVRRGKVGRYVDYFTQDDINYIDNYLDTELDEFFSMYKS